MEEIDLKELLTVIWRKKISIIVIVVISIIIGAVYSYRYTVPKYDSTATVILGKVSSTVGGDRWSENITISESDLSLNSSLILTYSELVGSRSIMEEVSERLNSNISVDDIMKSVKVSRVSTSDLLEVTATNEDPVLAKNIVTEVVDVFSEYVKEIYKIENVYIIDKPVINNEPYNINHVRDILISACIGIFVSFVYVSVYVFVDNTVKSSTDIENLLDVKTLINIPFDKTKEELITVNDSKSIISEAFKTLRTNIQFSNVDLKGPQTLLVTSCLPSEGKSYISANLAIAFAQVGKKVILVDSDMRRGRQSKIFKISNSNGLSNYISNIDLNGMEINWSLGEYIKKTNIKNLDLITAGSVPPNPAELLASARLADLVRLLKNYYDIIIFDGAPILPIADSLLLGRVLEKVMLVAVHNKTKKDNLVSAKASIEDVGGKVIGIALNKVAMSTGKYGDKYYYYYSADKEEHKVKDFISNKKGKIKTWCGNIIKKAKTAKKRLEAGWIPAEKELIEKRKAELAKQRDAEKRIKAVEIEEKARLAKMQADEREKKEAELAKIREEEKKKKEAEKEKLAEEKAKKDAELAKVKEAERLKKEKEKIEAEAKRLRQLQIEAEERAKEDAIMAEEKAKREEEEERKRAAEIAMKLELKKQKEEANAIKKKERAEKRAKSKEEWNEKIKSFTGKALVKKDEISEGFRIRKNEYSRKYNEYKIAKEEENKIKREEKERRNAEIAKIRAEEKQKREEERKIQVEERAKQIAIQTREKMEREAELARIREIEKQKREKERRMQAEERAKQLAIQAEERARQEEEAKFTEEYLQDNLYPKTKYNKF